MSEPFELPPQRRWPDDFHDGWRAEVVRDGFMVKHLHIRCRQARLRSDGPGQYMRVGLTFEPVDPHSFVAKGAMAETYEEERDGIGEVTGFLQAIVDAAYAVGIRPSQAAEQKDMIGTMRAHLEDMRALVFERPKP